MVISEYDEQAGWRANQQRRVPCRWQISGISLAREPVGCDQRRLFCGVDAHSC